MIAFSLSIRGLVVYQGSIPWPSQT